MREDKPHKFIFSFFFHFDHRLRLIKLELTRLSQYRLYSSKYREKEKRIETNALSYKRAHKLSN